MSYESSAQPIKLGYLFDFQLPEGYPKEMRDDLTQTFELVFDEGLRQGIIDRPVEIIFREVEGLPKGTVKAVIDAYGELVDEGCLRGVRSGHHRQLRADEGSHRAALPRAGDQRHGRRGLVGRVDLLPLDGLDDR